MRVAEATASVLQSPLLCYKERGEKSVPRFAGHVRAKAGAKGQPFAFLNTHLDSRRVSDKELELAFNLDLGDSYKEMLAGVNKLLEELGENDRITLPPIASNGEAINGILSKLESILSKKQLNLVVQRRDPYDEDCKDLDLVVYSNMDCFDFTVVVLYCSPASYLKDKARELFMRFMRTISADMNIDFGVSDSESCYLEMLGMEIEDTEDLDPQLAGYQKGNEYYEIFEEIKSLPYTTPDKLKAEIDEYRKSCERGLLADFLHCLERGLDVANLNIQEFCFDPSNDGIFDRDESSLETPTLTVIFYSPYDGLTDEYLSIINSDVGSGIETTGWNYAVQIREDCITKESVNQLFECKERGKRFLDWNDEFMKFVSDIENGKL